METDINKTKSDEIEKWREDFWSRFVFEDTGPDGDGYGADLPTWNEDFEHTEKYSQIVNITDFIRKLLISTRSQTLQEVCARVEKIGMQDIVEDKNCPQWSHHVMTLQNLKHRILTTLKEDLTANK